MKQAFKKSKPTLQGIKGKTMMMKGLHRDIVL